MSLVGIPQRVVPTYGRGLRKDLDGTLEVKLVLIKLPRFKDDLSRFLTCSLGHAPSYAA